jgi:hypothetical protein
MTFYGACTPRTYHTEPQFHGMVCKNPSTGERLQRSSYSSEVRSGEGLAVLVPILARESQQRAVRKWDFVKRAGKCPTGLLGARVQYLKPPIGSRNLLSPSRVLGRGFLGYAPCAQLMIQRRSGLRARGGGPITSYNLEYVSSTCRALLYHF